MYFNKAETTPIFASCMIETFNRCNGTCEFCPANVRDEKRPLKKMTEEMYQGIIAQLVSIGWSGKLWLSINNEPFLDNRIIDFAQYAKQRIKDVKIALVSNGTLLTPEKMDEMRGIIDEITINDYSEHYRLSKKHKSIYDHIRKHPGDFKGMEIIINRRYRKEILATRAGSAPNKPRKNNNVDSACIYPFLDFLIFPDGKVGMCCNDCFEETAFGDITKESMIEIWNNKKFTALREAMSRGSRLIYPFCANCDVVDAGGREKQILEFFKTCDIE